MAESSISLISLISADGETFNVSSIIVKQMKTVESFLEADESPVSITSSVIPLNNVNAFELSKVIDYIDYHHVICKGGENDEETKEFDEKFVKGLNPVELQMLLLAANYLNVEDLLELITIAIAKHLENKSVEYFWDYFNIGIDSRFPPEIEEEIRKLKENAWAFEGVGED